MSVEPDDNKEVGLYPKYKVYKIHRFDHETMGPGHTEELIEDPLFVLRPNVDKHARVALLAYAKSVRKAGYEKLADDIDNWIDEVKKADAAQATALKLAKAAAKEREKN